MSRTFLTELERDAEAPGVVMVFGSFFDMRLLVWFYNELEERLRKFGLELAQDKTRVIPFSRHRQGETSLWCEKETC